MSEELETVIRKHKCGARINIPRALSAEKISNEELARLFLPFVAYKMEHRATESEAGIVLTEVQGRVWIMNKFDVFEIALAAWKMGEAGESIHRFNPATVETSNEIQTPSN